MMKTSMSLSGGETLIAHLDWRQCPSQHIFGVCLEATKFNFSGAKRKIQDEFLVLYLCLVSRRGGIYIPH